MGWRACALRAASRSCVRAMLGACGLRRVAGRARGAAARASAHRPYMNPNRWLLEHNYIGGTQTYGKHVDDTANQPTRCTSVEAYAIYAVQHIQQPIARNARHWRLSSLVVARWIPTRARTARTAADGHALNCGASPAGSATARSDQHPRHRAAVLLAELLWAPVLHGELLDELLMWQRLPSASCCCCPLRS